MIIAVEYISWYICERRISTINSHCKMECNDEEISLMKTFKRWAKGIFLKATKVSTLYTTFTERMKNLK